MNDCRGGAQRLHSNRLGDFQHLFNGCLKLPTFNKSYTKKKNPSLFKRLEVGMGTH